MERIFTTRVCLTERQTKALATELSETLFCWDGVGYYEPTADTRNKLRDNLCHLFMLPIGSEVRLVTKNGTMGLRHATLYYGNQAMTWYAWDQNGHMDTVFAFLKARSYGHFRAKLNELQTQGA